jgi:formylglycine-generating enzyme required for sulfatase activity
MLAGFVTIMAIGTHGAPALHEQLPAYDDMVRVGPGIYRSLFAESQDKARVPVGAFYLDRYLVTNDQFVDFLRQQPEWGRGQIKPVFADANYLRQLDAGSVDAIGQQPVTNVSWFAAAAYCESRGKRLPAVDEWEFAGQASREAPDGTKDPNYRQQILEWYSKPASMRLPDVHATEPNFWGVHGMHGVVWELVEDFNSALVTGESRADSQLETSLYCGAGAAASVDPGDYAAFMRYAMRSSYEGDYTMTSMGFRCAADAR